MACWAVTITLRVALGSFELCTPLRTNIAWPSNSLTCNGRGMTSLVGQFPLVARLGTSSSRKGRGLSRYLSSNAALFSYFGAVFFFVVGCVLTGTLVAACCSWRLVSYINTEHSDHCEHWAGHFTLKTRS